MQLEDLYGVGANKAVFQARVDALEKQCIQETNQKPETWFSSSGRAEIIGNHTDHNCGKVIVAAISCDILAAVRKRNDGIVKVYSEGYPPFTLNVKDLKVNKNEYGKSIGLVRGVIKGIVDRGYKVGGFEVFSESTIFRGAGVSSSAAFELLFCEIINQLYLNGVLSKVEKAMISQYSENVYFGKPCGLLDQSGISLGGINEIDFRDLKNPQIEGLTAPKGYSLVITNTGGSHATLTEHYAAIKTEMHAVAEVFGKQYLREISYDEFFAGIPKLHGKVSERAIMRAFHFYEENDRVDVAADGLKKGNVSAFLNAINESGRSSMDCLQNCFVPGSDEQAVSLAIHMSSRLIHDGAVRIHGGGFAGTVIAYLADAEVANYVAEMSQVFGTENVFSASIRKPGACMLNLEELV